MCCPDNTKLLEELPSYARKRACWWGTALQKYEAQRIGEKKK